jgi:hypothetical protein
MTSPSPNQQPQARDRDEAEIRNWMLPLEQQDFRVPDPSRISLPEDTVEWSGRLFLLTRWFRRVAFWLTCLSVGVVLVSWAVWFVS